MSASREFQHDLGMWDRWLGWLRKHPLYDPDLTAKAIALYAYYYCDHAGHTTLSADDYAAAIEAIIPNSSVNFNALLNQGEWERWVATWAGLHIKHAIDRPRGCNRLLALIEHRYIEPITPKELVKALMGGCAVYDELVDTSSTIELSQDMSDATMRGIIVDHPQADMSWEELYDAAKTGN
jgi:hypothetical protein